MFVDSDFLFWLLFLGVLLTYIVWGVAFAFQALLLLNDVESAKKWVRRWYSLKSFRRELIAFYPMIKLFYFLLEYIPDLVLKDKIIAFNSDAIWQVACKVIIKAD